MEFFTGGNIGEWFTAMAFGSAFVALWSFLMAERETDLEKKSWERLGIAGFVTHIASILGIIGTLFYLIYAHKYQYHYVWSHSSNELPVYYMISCFWEGQEGSFLLWCFWHSMLGGVLLFNKGPWRNLVIAVIASVELILTSMLLGVYINASWISGIFLLMVLLPGVYMGMQYFTRREELPLHGVFHLASGFMAIGFAILLFRGQLGVGANYILLGLPNSLDSAVFFLFGKFVLAYAIGYLIYLNRVSKNNEVPVIEILSGAILIGLTMVGMGVEPDTWKLGSSPFTLLKAVFPNSEAYALNADFVPSNGNGLNPLLQNYWMVIHPPTLFLGFASTVVPFAFVIAGLIKGQYHQWIKPALPWMAFSVMILGVGIIMGGYWAYETLNFGGYWNWDPVENSSLVPWLCGVASLHAMLIYRKTKAYLKLTQLMIIGTFLLVLYSTFLTRSGILGETSVHTFTDLGLSGQLLVLVMTYVGLVSILMLFRWNKIPQRADESTVWSAEFMLFTGTLVFLFSSLVIAFSTSLPVFNEIFNSNLAPPTNVQEFYYTWNVWFAILFGLLSGLGQFLWWKISRKKSVLEALYTPFLLTMLSGSAIIVGLALSGMDFAYDKKFAEMIAAGNIDHLGFFGKAIAYLKYAVLTVADELLLFSSLFAIFANGNVLIHLLRKNKKGLKVMGGTVVHIGFGFMLLGMLFSSGYDSVISKNLRPQDLAQFPEDERNDNVALVKNGTNYIEGFTATYIGKKIAEAPISGLHVIEENAFKFKARFDDASGERFAIVQERSPYLSPADREKLGVHARTAKMDQNSKPIGKMDLSILEKQLNQDILSFNPKLINNRTLYGIEFESYPDAKDKFVLYPEAELNEDMGGITSHPARRIYWDRDIYVYTSSLPKPEAEEPQYHSFGIKLGDTVRIGENILQLQELKNLSEREDLRDFDIAAAAHIMILTPKDTFMTNPIYVIKGNRPGMISSHVEQLGMDIAFVGISPGDDLIHLQVRQVDPRSDFVIIKAISKPFINLLWLGTFILVIGFLISIYRRIGENKTKKTA